ncbi:unnamed protein product [Polarella glacialis]|nr:unnamed protein product [Polarella glacialis]
MAATREYSEMRVKGKMGKKTGQDLKQPPPGAVEIRDIVEAAMVRAGRDDSDMALPVIVAASVGGAEIFPTLLHWVCLHFAKNEDRQESAARAAAEGDKAGLLREMYAALRSMPYSVALGPPRKILADAVVDGMKLPAGALLFAMHPAVRCCI